MIFVSFEDETSIFETVLFPDAFRRYYPLLDDGWAFLVHGRVDEDFGALSIGVERLVKVSRDSGTGGSGEAAATDVAAPERPPVFAWWSGEGTTVRPARARAGLRANGSGWLPGRRVRR